MDIEAIRNVVARLKAQVASVVVGQETVVEALLVALLSEGHILLEGPPGTAKTLLARVFAASLDLGMNRIQFTPDLMPGDVLGTNLYNFQTAQFTLTKGPIFTDFLLADEINRTPPKTQAALLEAMQERRVTIDGAAHELGETFMVVATQNPLEQQGTYPLPEAQLDRFLFKHVLSYPDRADERRIVAAYGMRSGQADPGALGVETVADAKTLAAAHAAVASVRLTDEIVDYVLDLVRATRESADLQSGASPRSAAQMAMAARARAALDGRDYVIPDDVKALAAPVLRHRVILSPAAEIDGRKPDQVLAALVDQTAAPR